MRNLAEAQELDAARLYLACLMPNHFHLLVETPAGNLSAFMGRLLTAYAVYYNRRHRRVGHLTQGRYKAQVFGITESALRRRSRNRVARGAAAWALVRHAGLTQRAAAEVLGMGTGAAVSQQMAKWRSVVSADEGCWKFHAQLDEQLASTDF